MNGVVNEQLIYDQSKLPLGGRREELEFFNSMGNINGGRRCMIRIPNLSNSYLHCDNAYLRFTVAATVAGVALPFIDTTSTPPNAPTNTANLKLSSCSAASFIKSITILNENICCYKCEDSNKIASIIQLSDVGLNGYNAKSVLDGSAISEIGNFDGLKVCESFGLPTAASTATLSVLPEMTFCVNSNIFGLLGSGVLPINQIRNGLLLQVEFVADVRIPFKNDGASSSSLLEAGSSMVFKDISYCVPSIILDDSSQAAVAAENGFGERPTVWSDIIRRCSVITVPKATYSTSQVRSVLIPNNRYKSLNNILMGSFVSPNGHSDGNAAVFPYSTIQYRYQGVERPNEVINTLPQLILNTVSCHSNVSPSIVSCVFDKEHSALNYRPPLTTSIQTITPRLVAGVDFTAFNDDSVISGIDTSNGDTQVELTIVGAASNFDMRDCFVSTFSCVWIINEGRISCSFN